MKLTPAFQLLHEILPSEEPVRPHGYKAPHANRGTPPRLRLGRKGRKRLFKGHRP